MGFNFENARGTYSPLILLLGSNGPVEWAKIARLVMAGLD
jgi:hypothetical protein